MKNVSTLLIVFGILCVFLGVFLSLGATIPWLGRLPGDIHIERPGLSFYFPITTSVLISIVVSLLLYLFRVFR